MIHLFGDDERAVEHYQRGEFVQAIEALDAGLATFGDNPRRRWSRGHCQLALGRYDEALADWECRFEMFDVLTENGSELFHRLPRWRGEDIAGKRLAVLAEQGLGDVVMLLRFIPVLQARGIDVVLDMPPPLRWVAAQLAPVETDGADLCVPMFDLLTILRVTPATIPAPPYLTPDRVLVKHWRKLLGNGKPSIGIAWSTRYLEEARSLTLERFVDMMKPGSAVRLVALQIHDLDDAERLGILVPRFSDYADLAAVISLMDGVVSVDTGAINVAGAIGHPYASVLLPNVPNWRWHAPWYPNVRQHRQASPGDWRSALC